jgi:DNA-binding HxlR family transcriptional regulator
LLSATHSTYACGVADGGSYPLASPDVCSIARTLDVLGDTWSVLVIREMFLGTHRFDQLQEHLGIARNILAARLRRLVEHGIVSKRPYQAHPPRFEYHLTRKGVDLYPVVVGLMQWGDRYLAGARGGPVVLEHTRCGQLTELVPACSACGKTIDPREMRALPR